MRLFFAIWPPTDVVHRLHEWAADVRHETGGRPTRIASIHLTLAFLGEQNADRCALAASSARTVAATAAAARGCASSAIAPFELALDTPGYFRHNRIAWVGPRIMPDALSALVKSLHEVLVAVGFELEQRAFKPHLTLLREAREPSAWPPLHVGPWLVREFVLVESVRDHRGARYEIRERFALEAT